MMLQILSKSPRLIWQSSMVCRDIGCLRTISVSRRSQAEVRVRFAPSPTGFLHLGGLRTALYNYLFAQNKGGKFILRIEDTDQSRLVPEAAEKLESILKWSGIIPDESPILGGSYGPYVQSQRNDIYRSYIQKLLDNGSAYKCYCTEMRLNLLREDLQRRGEFFKYDNACRHLSSAKMVKFEKEGLPFCIRLKLEDIKPFKDIIYGSILINIAEQEGDPVLVKTDGFPTYHFANVVDDHLMGVTHVLRGFEWLGSTPKHLLLYKAFGWDPPEFAHLPLIKNPDGTKLSKRQGDFHIGSLKAQGYSAKTILNFATNIGGGFEDREHDCLLPMEELIEKFRLDKINPNSCQLQMEKLHQFSNLDFQQRLEDPSKTQQMIKELRHMVHQTYGKRLTAYGTPEKVLSDEHLLEVFNWSKNRVSRVHDLLTPEFAYVWVVPEDLALHQLPSMSSSPSELLAMVIENLASISPDDFTKENVFKCVKDIGKKHGVKVPHVMALVRRSISGLKQGPPVGEMLTILGQETSLERLKHAQSLL